jgi:hypothetical protein
MTVKSLVDDISKDVETELPDIFNKCLYYSLTVDESTDITSTSQMCIVARRVKCDVQVFEDLVDRHSMLGQTKGSNFSYYYVVLLG